MILLRKICLQDVSEQGKSFKWEAHDCEKCKRRMWGHGYVARYFAVLVAVIFMKRFRCPQCKTVATTRPIEYYSRVRSAVEIIYQTLKFRIERGCWGSGVSRQRAGHWLRKFGIKIRMDFCHLEMPEALDFCFGQGIHFFS